MTDSYPKSAVKKMRILVVDDSEDFCWITSVVLEDHGMDVKTSTSTKQALAELEEFQPDLVVTDVTMPEMNGEDFVRKVNEQRAFQGLSPLPSIAITGQVDRPTSVDSHITSYLKKPLDYEKLIEKIHQLVIAP